MYNMDERKGGCKEKERNQRGKEKEGERFVHPYRVGVTFCVLL